MGVYQRRPALFSILMRHIIVLRLHMEISRKFDCFFSAVRQRAAQRIIVTATKLPISDNIEDGPQLAGHFN